MNILQTLKRVNTPLERTVPYRAIKKLYRSQYETYRLQSEPDRSQYEQYRSQSKTYRSQNVPYHAKSVQDKLCNPLPPHTHTK